MTFRAICDDQYQNLVIRLGEHPVFTLMTSHDCSVALSFLAKPGCGLDLILPRES